MAASKQVEANRQNGLEGGVKSEEGKAISSLNARRSALNSRPKGKHGIFAVALTPEDEEGKACEEKPDKAPHCTTTDAILARFVPAKASQNGHDAAPDKVAASPETVEPAPQMPQDELSQVVESTEAAVPMAI